MSALLTMTNVAMSFRLPTGERLDILRELDLSIAAREFVAIVGRSGSGKSTLLNLFGMLDTPSGGAYTCDGIDVSSMGDARRSRLRGEFFGFVFQQFYLLDRRTALENVAEPMLLGSRRDIARRFERARHMLESVGLTERAQSMPHLLSGGEQQRVAIARALVRQPRVILADEPTGSLDEATSGLVLDMLISTARHEGATLVLVTHDMEVARRADRILTLSGGTLHEGIVS